MNTFKKSLKNTYLLLLSAKLSFLVTCLLLIIIGTSNKLNAETRIVTDFVTLDAAINFVNNHNGLDSIVIMSDIKLESDLRTFRTDSLVITAPTNSDGTPVYTIDGNSFRFVFATSLIYCIVENLTVSNCSRGGAIYLSDSFSEGLVNKIKVHNCIVNNNLGNGIEISFTRNTIVEINNCKTNNNMESGFRLGGNLQSQLTVTNCESDGNATNGFYISNASKTRIEGCITKNNGYGFQIFNGREVFINQCNISGNKTGILFNNFEYCIINNCSINGSTDSGIEFDNRSSPTGGCIISNTTIFNNAKSDGSGIKSNDAHLKIINSSVINNDSWGVVISNYTDDMLKPVEIYNSIIFGHRNRDLNVYNNVEKTFLYNSVFGRIFSNNNNYEAINCSNDNPKLVWINAEGNITENLDEATHYFLAEGSSAFELADRSLITTNMLTNFNSEIQMSDWLKNIISGEYFTNLLKYDQMGNLRIFNGNRYNAGSIDGNIELGEVWSYTPQKVANYGKSTIIFYGDNLDNNTKFTLKKQGEPNIVADKTVSEYSTTLNTNKCLVTFNFHNRQLGKWDIVIENGGETVTISNGFEIEESIGPYIHAEFIGPQTFRNNAFTPVTIKYYNEGNVTVYCQPVIVEIIADKEVVVVVREKWEYIYSEGTYTDLYGVIDGEYCKLDTLHNEGTNTYSTYITPMISDIPPYSFGYLTFDVRFTFEATGTQPIKMSVFPTPSFCFFDPEADRSEGISLKAASLGQTIWGCALNDDDDKWKDKDIPMPGMDCSLAASNAAHALLDGKDKQGYATSASRELGKIFDKCVSPTDIPTPKTVGKALKVFDYISKAHDGYEIIKDLSDCVNDPNHPYNPNNPDNPGGKPKKKGYSGIAGGSKDPNDKIGPLNEFGSTAFTDRTEFTYIINFENDAEEATFPAQEVWIRDTLDINVFDINTFNAGIISIGSRVIETPPNRQNFTWTVDMKPQMNLKTKVTLNLDKNKGVAEWYFKTIDPATGELPVEATDGFLPPNNDDGDGQGFVMFTIKLKDELPDNVVVANKAEIIFDYNDPIITDEWINKKDIIPPTSTMFKPANQTGEIELNWQGEDNPGGSGIYCYDVFVNKNNDGYIQIQNKTPNTSMTFTVENGIKYEFYTLATDSAGNIEIKTKIPDITVPEEPQTSTITLNANPNEGGNPSGGGTFAIGTAITVSANPNNKWSFVNWTENAVEVSTNVDYSFNVNNNRVLTANYKKDSEILPVNPKAEEKGNNALITWGSVTWSSNQQTSTTNNETSEFGITGYSVYRLIEGNPQSVWNRLISNRVAHSYIDDKWGTLPAEKYRYAVSINFNDGTESSAVITNILEKSGTKSNEFIGTFSENCYLHPNPFTDEIFVSITNYELHPEIYSRANYELRIEIFNSLGHKVKDIVFDDKPVFTDDLQSGVYFMVVINTTGERAVFKMIKISG